MKAFLATCVACLFALQANASFILDFSDSGNGPSGASSTIVVDLDVDPVEASSDTAFAPQTVTGSPDTAVSGSLSIEFTPIGSDANIAQFSVNGSGFGVAGPSGGNGLNNNGESVEIAFDLSGVVGSTELVLESLVSTSAGATLVSLNGTPVSQLNVFTGVSIADGDVISLTRTGSGNERFSAFTFDFASGVIIPEPATASLLCGMLGLVGAARRRR